MALKWTTSFVKPGAHKLATQLLNQMCFEPESWTPNQKQAQQQHSPQLPASLGTEATQPDDDAGMLAFQSQDMAPPKANQWWFESLRWWFETLSATPLNQSTIFDIYI